MPTYDVTQTFSRSRTVRVEAATAADAKDLARWVPLGRGVGEVRDGVKVIESERRTRLLCDDARKVA